MAAIFSAQHGMKVEHTRGNVVDAPAAKIKVKSRLSAVSQAQERCNAGLHTVAASG
jgi:hypothetical protein